MMDELVLGLETTVIGVGIVFLALYALSLIMVLFRKLFYKEPDALPATDRQTVASGTGTMKQNEFSEEVVAAIAAAIAAATGKSADQFAIVGIRNADQKSPWTASGWKMAGRTDLMEKRQEHYR
jgi:glutaconyl-CoA/methylmalonyl-CoA decarboxylase subunit delta